MHQHELTIGDARGIEVQVQARVGVPVELARRPVACASDRLTLHDGGSRRLFERLPSFRLILHRICQHSPPYCRA
jgi:hypothetical protein